MSEIKVNYEPYDTGFDVIKKALKSFKEHGKNAIYVVYEYNVPFSPDNNGSNIMSPKYIFENGYLRDILDAHKKNKGLTNEMIQLILGRLEIEIGAPSLPDTSSISVEALETRSKEELKARLDKLQKSIVYDIKRLQQISKNCTDTQNRSLIGARKALEYLYAAGEGQDKSYALESYRRSIVAREKDKLFYVRRHPEVRMLHRCHNEAILSCINEFRWFFISNPFAGFNKHATHNSSF